MRLPDPELVRAFGRAVRAHFEKEVAEERKASEARRAAVLPKVRAALGERSDVDLLVEDCADPIAVASVVGRGCGLDVHVIRTSDAAPSLREPVRDEGVPL